MDLELGLDLWTARAFFAFGLTLLCGLTVCLGGVMALTLKKLDPGLFCLCFSFAAGIMLCLGVSATLESISLASVSAFLTGAVLMAVLGALSHKRSGEMGRTGTFSALAIAAHNFPEGFVLFSAALLEPILGLTMGGAMVAHNIPLGIAIALPIRYASHSRLRAMGFTLLSGLAPVTGALLGCLLLRPLFSADNLDLLSAGTGGVMVCIAVLELLPSARSYGRRSKVFSGLCAGVFFMLCVILLAHFT